MWVRSETSGETIVCPGHGLMSAQGQTVGSVRLEAATGSVVSFQLPSVLGCFQSVFPRPLADPDVRACGAPGFTVAVRRKPHIQRTVSE